MLTVCIIIPVALIQVVRALLRGGGRVRHIGCDDYVRRFFAGTLRGTGGHLRGL